MIEQRLLTAAIRTLGPEDGREWDFLGGVFAAGTLQGVDASCFVIKAGVIRAFEAEEESLFLLREAVICAREALFEDVGAPRFRHCLSIVRGTDEASVTHYSYADDPEWGEIMADCDKPEERMRAAFSWRHPKVVTQ